jgi:hypothetical protein
VRKLPTMLKRLNFPKVCALPCSHLNLLNENSSGLLFWTQPFHLHPYQTEDSIDEKTNNNWGLTVHDDEERRGTSVNRASPLCRCGAPNDAGSFELAY